MRSRSDGRRRDLPVDPRPQLPAVLQRSADLADRQLAHARRADAARATSSPHNGVALGVLAAAQFGPVLVARTVGRPGRRPFRQAQAAAHRADDRDGAVVRARGARVQRPPAGAGDLRGRVDRRRHRRVRQPGAPGVRGRDGARRRHAERGEPQQRADDVVPGRSAPRSPACSS